jgi:hypothetical protein
MLGAMTETEWLACTNPTAMVNFLREKAGDRKLRLFFCACCRSVWHLLDEPLLRRAVEVAERHADGLADDQQLQALGRELCPAFPYFTGSLKAAAAFSAVAGRGIFPVRAPSAAVELTYTEAALQALDQGRTHIPIETKAGFHHFQAHLLRCIVGPLPFHLVSVQDDWRTTSVAAIDQAIYEDRAFDRMPELADALERAGCADAEILAHCRGPGPHVRGCWVVDLLLGKD